MTRFVDDKDDPRRPCHAYGIVAQLLGPTWFALPPVWEGTAVEVRGLDGITSTWHLGNQATGRLAGELRTTHGVHVARLTPFERKGLEAA